VIRLEQGDCRDIVPALAAGGVVADAICTDPPYHLVPGGTAERAARRRLASRDGSFSRLERGFMGTTWDGGDIAFRPDTWARLATALRPGGFLLAFGGTRTWHRLACAIEDAGFVIQDTVLWLYGSGFPKRRDMLKPAWEPIVVAYKPGGKRMLQVDECRIGTAKRDPGYANPGSTAHRQSEYGLAENRNGDDLGRWPANVCHDGSAEVVEAFAAFGETTRGHYPAARGRGGIGSNGHSGQSGLVEINGDIGSAARFFYCAKADLEDRWGSAHPTVKPIELVKWLVALVTPKGGLVLDPFAGSGTTAVAALATGRHAILIEQEAQYIADIRERLAFYDGTGRHSLVSKNRNRRPTESPLL
jgi:site-specific DNA-methyltransferase (adenine-specific)